MKKPERVTRNIWRFPDQFFYSEIVNIWLLADTDRIIVIDGPEATSKNMHFVSTMSKPITIILTHAPCIGNAEEFRERIGAEIVIHEVAKKQKLDFKPDRYVKDGEKLSASTTVIHTPRHKPEHICLFSPLESGSMFTGDSIQADSKGDIIDPWEPGTDVDTNQNTESLRKLLRYDFERILPFHYFPLLKDAKEKMKSVLEEKR